MTVLCVEELFNRICQVVYNYFTIKINYWSIRCLNANPQLLEFLYSPTKTAGTGSSFMPLDSVGNLVISGNLTVNGSAINTNTISANTLKLNNSGNTISLVAPTLSSSSNYFLPTTASPSSGLVLTCSSVLGTSNILTLK